MTDAGVLAGRPLGGMVPAPSLLTPGRETALVRADGRPQPEVRAQWRAIPSWRNAVSVASVWVQAIVIVGLAVWWGNPVGYVLAFLLMGRTHAQFAALMHEAAHRLLFRNRRVNDWVGRWLLGFPAFTPIDAYRRGHMAHHRDEFGPDEPDIPLYRGYPISPRQLPPQARPRRHRAHRAASCSRQLFARRSRSSDARVASHAWKILLVQAVLLAVGDRRGALVGVPRASGSRRISPCGG